MKHTNHCLNSKLCGMLLPLGLAAFQLAQANSEFNTAFLDLQNSDAASLDAVIRGYAIQPGQYKFSIVLNQERIDERLIAFVVNQQTKQVEPCIDSEILSDYAVIYNQELVKDQQCIDLSALIDHASVSFDAGLQELKLSIPQVNLAYRPKGFIPNKLYDEGITAALLNYNVSGSYSNNQLRDHFSYLNITLNGGFNLGAWRYRNSSNFSSQTGVKNSWTNISNRLERNIVPWRSRLVLGDTSSGADLFDSFNFRGLKLASDDLQLAYSLQNYSPTVRGVAASNATVEIRQNGYLIYSLNVAPGAFEIKDIVSANESGDLYIKVIESDGRTKEFVQAYSAVPNMLRPGQWRYELSSGSFRSGSTSDYEPYFAQATLGYGLNNDYTPYAGLLLAQNYTAAGLGLGLSLGRWGALSTDITYAKTNLASGGDSDGASVKFLYSKSLNRYGTSIKILGYRYSTQGYYDFSDAVSEQAEWRNGVYEYQYETTSNPVDGRSMLEERKHYAYSSAYYNKKNQIQLSFSQNFGQHGQAFANWSNTSYWNGGLDQQSWQLGYALQLKAASFNLYYQSNQSRFNGNDYTVGLNVSIPLDRQRKKTHQLISSSSVQYNQESGSDIQTGVSGSFLQDNNLHINAQGNVSDQSLSLSAAYQGSRADAELGYSYHQDYQQYSANLRGGLLIHAGGLVFGQQLSSSPIIVEAKGATGVRIENQAGLAISPQGYAIIRASNPYRRNRVALRAEDLGGKINVDQAVQQDIVPTKDAIVKVSFDVSHGQSVLAKISTQNGQTARLGAVVFNTKHKQVGIVGTDGQAYITGVSSGERLLLSWGEDQDEQCRVTLPNINEQDFGYSQVSMQCQ